MFDTPVLLLIFNRPDNTRQVFEAIKKVKPNQLFIAADGAREGKEGEMELCGQARQIATDVDWQCEVKTLFREHNLGCKYAVSSAIDWFFEQVEQGIILEDDCIPNHDFFGYCAQLLYYYKADPRIMMICGTNYLPAEISDAIKHSYFFSNYYPIWGWATWKRAWDLYDVEMKSWDNFKERRQLFYRFSSSKISSHYEYMFDLIKNGFDTWDIQWWYTCIFQSGLAIVPKYNLISNIGIVGTHTSTQGNYSINMPTQGINYKNLIHPHFVFADKYLNEMTYKKSHAQIDMEEPVNGHDASNGVAKLSSVKYIVKGVLRRLLKK